MSPIRVCFFTFLVFVGIAVQFAVCGDECDQPIKLGSDEPNIGKVEELLLLAKNGIGKINNNIKDEPDKTSKKKYMIGNPLILLGTKWCGAGNKAKNQDDIGRYNDTDMCCRTHDNCQSNILIGEIKLNLKNSGFYTRSNCLCDKLFYDCLKTANSFPANWTGKFYFEQLQLQCFECVCPVDGSKDGSEDGCKKYAWRDNKKWIISSS